jgi:hypothetical protein
MMGGGGDPAKMAEMMKDPEVASVMNKLMSKMGGGGMPDMGGMGGMPGGMGGMPGGMGGMPGGMGGMPGGFPGGMGADDDDDVEDCD